MKSSRLAEKVQQQLARWMATHDHEAAPTWTDSRAQTCREMGHNELLCAGLSKAISTCGAEWVAGLTEGDLYDIFYALRFQEEDSQSQSEADEDEIYQIVNCANCAGEGCRDCGNTGVVYP